MKKPEELRGFCKELDEGVTRNQDEIKKIKKKIARLNKEVRVLRKRVKTHKHPQAEPSPDAVIILKVSTRGKKVQRLNSVLIQIQTEEGKKPKKKRGRKRNTRKSTTKKRRSQKNEKP
ncbi:MAG: hypothetical protein Q7R94_02750 [bacterium]|nr:hypothetical protein [bacterium]